VPELAGISAAGNGFRVGAMTVQADVARSAELAAVPLLGRATRLIGHFQIRNRGTVGGSVAHADPAAEYPAVTVVLDATMEAAGPAGVRRIPAAGFFDSAWTTTLRPDEILTAIEFPRWNGGFAVKEIARRHGDFAVAGVACGLSVDGGTITRAAIAWFGMGPAPIRAVAAERALTGSTVTGLDLAEVAGTAAADVDPPSDQHASAAGRRRMGRALARQALADAIEEAQGNG